MADGIEQVAKKLRKFRERNDPVSEASQEALPYKRRVKDVLGALRALVTDDTPTSQLDGDLRVVHGLVSAPLAFLPRLRGAATVASIRGLDWKRDERGGLTRMVLAMGERASVLAPSATVVASRTLQEHYRLRLGR